MLVWFGAIVYAAFFVLGFVITTQQKQQYTPLTNNVKYMLVAHIADVPIQKEKTRKLVLDVFQIANGTQWTKTKAKVLAYIANDSASQKLCMGDIIEVTAYANPIETFKTNGKFDYPLFMARKHICNQMYIPNYAWKLVGKDSLWSVRAFSLQVSSKIHNIYTACKLQPEESAVLNALMLGIRTDVSPEILADYASTGAIHILVVNGLRVGILYLILSWCLLFMRGKILQVIKVIIIVLCIWLYAFLTGFTSSIERAAIMFTLIAIARQFRLSSNMYNTLAATALITLVINPFDLFDMGFQLSYLAIIGIFYFTKKADELYRPQSWLLYKAWELVVVSLAAQALTLPLCLYYFGQIPVYFIITNLITIPVTFAVMILGIAVVPLYYVSQSLFHLVSMLLQTSVFIQNYTVKTIAHFPFATIHYCTSFGITLAMYAAIVCCGYLFERRRFI